MGESEGTSMIETYGGRRGKKGEEGGKEGGKQITRCHSESFRQVLLLENGVRSWFSNTF